MSRFDDCLKFVFSAEGGYVDDPFDRGGATNFGITQDTYNAYRARHHLPFQPVQFITKDEARSIYREDYWQLLCCDRLPKPLDLVVFDAGVNCGIRASAKFLQRALGVADDGIIGNKTISAVIADKDNGLLPHVIATCLDERRSYYDTIVKRDASQARFHKGWINRVAMLETETEVV